MAGQRLLQQGEQRRKDIVKFIGEFRRAHGHNIGPTIQEIAQGVGLGSANATRHHLLRLKDEGTITMDTKVGRSIALTADAMTLDELNAKKWPKTARFVAITGSAPRRSRARKPAGELAAAS